MNVRCLVCYGTDLETRRDWCPACGRNWEDWLDSLTPERRRQAELYYYLGAIGAWVVNLVVIATVAVILWWFAVGHYS